MTVRIYQLAKNLKKTSKQIIDACQELDLRANKNNRALAVLTDEEVRKIEEFFAKDEQKPRVEENATEKNESVDLPEMIPPTEIPSQEHKKVQVIPPVIKPRTNGFSSFFGSFSKSGKKNSDDDIDQTKSVEENDSVATEKLEDTLVASDVTVDQIVGQEVNDNNKSEQTQIDAVKEETTVAQVAETVVESSDLNSVGTKREQLEVREEESIVEQDNGGVIDEGKAVDERETVSAEANDQTPVECVSEEKEASSEGTQNQELVNGAVNEVGDKISASAVDNGKDDLSKNSAEVVKSERVEAQEVKTNVSVSVEDDVHVEVAKKTSENPSQKKMAPLTGAISRKGRDGRGDQRNERRNNQTVKSVDNHSARPVPLSPPAYAGQFERAQALDEMKRPPMITSGNGNGRVRVLGAGPRKTNESEASSSNKSANKNQKGRSNISLHLAPVPAASVKSQPKKVQEVVQKPIKTYTPETFKQKPLEHLVSERNRRNSDAADKKSGEVGRTDSKEKNQRSGRPGQIGYETTGDSHGRKSGRFGERGASEEELRRKPIGGNKRRGGNKPVGQDEDDYNYNLRVGRKNKTGKSAPTTAPRTSDIVIEMPCTVKGFSEATGKSVAELIKTLMKLGMMMTMNQTLEAEVIELLILEFNLKATIKKPATLEEQYVDTAINEVDPPESLVPRAPVVTFLGHVDHGKTSLLDRILHLHVVSGEKGGITQHIRAYRVDAPNGGSVTFVDTPGHEAFTEMRARGANCTDIAVLVVAADDGVMPQTEEAISHAKAAGVPIVVALNKMDLPGVNRDKVIQELANNDLMPSEWGGDVEVIETSAVTGMGVDKLLETLLTIAELSELKANPNRNATGVVLEASMQAGEGVVCKALVQNGTLKNGDVVLCGSSYGRVRSMTDTLDPHKRIKEAGPSVPVSLTGLDVAPEAGSKFVVLEDISVARQIAEERSKIAREVQLAGTASHVTLESLFERINSAKTQQTLSVIIRADVRGSIEAIRKELGKLDHPEVKVKILQASVGGITEADVYLADASDAIIVGFNVVPDEGARVLAEAKKVQIRRYDIIYKLTEDIRAALEGMLKPIEQIKELGRALVLRTFNISRVGVIAGSRVLHGTIERDCQIRVIRDSRVIGEYTLDTLKREKDDAKEVREGYECGIKLKNYNDVKEGDILEAYKIEEVARTL